MSSIASDFLSIIASDAGAAFGVIAVWVVDAFIPGFDIVPIEFDIWAFAVALSDPRAITVINMFLEVIKGSLKPALSSLATAKRARDVHFAISFRVL